MFLAKFKPNRPVAQVFKAWVAIKIIAIGLVGATLAHADSPLPRVSPLTVYQQECASCHIAYPPGMLPSASWQRLMGGLSQHFGTDAALEAAQVREIGAWLQVHAGTYRRVSEEPPPGPHFQVRLVCAQTPRGQQPDLEAIRRKKRG